MKVSIITIGDELLKGSTVNTNAAFLGECLLEIGIVPSQNLVVPDSPDAICKALDYLVPDSELIITSGGLGPTGDDLTRDVIAGYFKLKLVSDESICAIFKDRWQRLKNCPPPPKVLEQALVPEGGEAFINEVGTAPGLWFQADSGKYVCMLPGPPLEQRPMVAKQLIPKLKSVLKNPVAAKVYYIAHASESEVEKSVESIIKGKNIKTAYCASYDHVKLFLSCMSEHELSSVCAEVESHFGEQLLKENCKSMTEDIIIRLKEKCLTLSTAESCTGGMIAAGITSIPGASEIFAGSLVAYCNDIKTRCLNVTREVLDTYGAVSEQCVASMVENLCARFITSAGIAVSGIAGPDGGTPEKPVGLVYIAVKVNGQCKVIKCNFSGNRDAIRHRAVAEALYILREMLLQ
ncbi:MAG: CinA family nicotinamide mononucleotide deamidase-related protein [Victivallales bacterium]|nr:CinA family nicotinamide mononucleotide deamidase-related protein [Victivallales bacterium]